MVWKKWENFFLMGLELERNGHGNNYMLSMELGWNGMDCSVEFSGEGIGKGME